jgi:prepilin-type N-terminal cleavage/methylation domain-containing protein
MRRHAQRGFSLLELMVSLTVTLLIMTGVTTMMLHNARINKAQQMTAQAQSNARNCLAMIVQRLRSAGWDPLNTGVPSVTLDTDTGDDIAEIEIFADLDSDGLTDGIDEQVLIRHVGDRIVWRRSNDVSEPFVILATNISNDANGDGTIENMFVPSSTPDPQRVTVQITAQSPMPNPMSGEFIRFTASTDVVLRKAL